MVDIERLIKISTNRSEPVNAAGEWLRDAKNEILCPECRKIKDGWYPNPINIVLFEPPTRRIAGGVWGTGLSIFNVDFIQQIKPYLDGFVIGKCFGPDGRLLQEYVTCYSRHWILQRGDKQSEYWICKACEVIYQSGWSGPQYTLRGYLTDARIYMSSGGRMYIDDKIASKLDFSPWPDVVLKRIKVCDKPQDGLMFSIDKNQSEDR
jgi:hypothetical protein